MAIIGVPTITAAGIPADASRALPVRDPLLDGVLNNGVRFLFDLAFPFCYPGGPPTGRPAAGAPANGALVQDVAERANGSVAVPGGTIAYSGGGFDFTNSAPGALTNMGVIAPASVLADIATAFGGKVQRYLICAYIKLPALANWNPSATLLSMIGDKAFNAGASLITINQNNAGALNLRRQVAAATGETSTFSIAPAPEDYGSVVQIGAWRNDAGQGFRLKSAKGTVSPAPLAVGVDNNQDFSANPFCFGRAIGAFAGAAGTGVAAPFSGVRVYRGFVENLARSGRDPVTVLDADYTATLARNVFS